MIERIKTTCTFWSTRIDTLQLGLSAKDMSCGCDYVDVSRRDIAKLERFLTAA